MNEHGGDKWIYVAAPNITDQLAALEEKLKRQTDKMRSLDSRGNARQPAAIPARDQSLLKEEATVKYSPIKVAIKAAAPCSSPIKAAALRAYGMDSVSKDKLPQKRARIEYIPPGPLQGCSTQTPRMGKSINFKECCPNRNLESYHLPSSAFRGQLREAQMRLSQFDRQLSGSGTLHQTNTRQQTARSFGDNQNRKNLEDFSSLVPMGGLSNHQPRKHTQVSYKI
jgi:hypothetical protein